MTQPAGTPGRHPLTRRAQRSYAPQEAPSQGRKAFTNNNKAHFRALSDKTKEHSRALPPLSDNKTWRNPEPPAVVKLMQNT